MPGGRRLAPAPAGVPAGTGGSHRSTRP